MYTKLFSKDFKNPEGLKVTSTEVFWTPILNYQHDSHTIYQINIISLRAIATEATFIQPLRQERAHE